MHPDKVAFVFRHWPLSYHPHAFDAAKSVECAAHQGRFKQLHELYYGKQDSIGVKSVLAFASEAGITDTAAFKRCLEDPRITARVELDIALITELEGTGTPTLFVNGSRYSGAPDSAMFVQIVEREIESTDKWSDLNPPQEVKA